MKNIKKIIIAFLLIMPLTAYLKSEEKKVGLNAAGLIKNPKVDVSWNRYYDSSQIKDIMIKLEKAFPSLAKAYSIGKSTEGRDIICIEITNFKKGNPDKKPGMYIDGNIHGNEIQGSEVALYTAWYLLENYGNNQKNNRTCR
ncbi:MAG: M14 family zinc carboxypeptidase [Acidobacteriota bacterium]